MTTKIGTILAKFTNLFRIDMFLIETSTFRQHFINADFDFRAQFLASLFGVWRLFATVCFTDCGLHNQKY